MNYLVYKELSCLPWRWEATRLTLLLWERHPKEQREELGESQHCWPSFCLSGQILKWLVHSWALVLKLGAALAHREPPHTSTSSQGAPHTHSLGSGNGRGRDYVRSLTMSSFRWVTTSSLFTTLCPICTFPSAECAGGSLHWQLVSTAGFLRTGWLIPHSARSEHMSRKSWRQPSGGYCWSGSVIMQRCWGLHHTCTIWDTNHHLPDVKKRLCLARSLVVCLWHLFSYMFDLPKENVHS